MKKRYIVSILSNMCQSRASNLKSGWKVVLSTLSAAVRASYSLGRFFSCRCFKCSEHVLSLGRASASFSSEITFRRRDGPCKRRMFPSQEAE